MIWFTSDTHFGHKNIIKYCNRPFASASIMDAEMMRRWNEKVSEEDTVYHLGDFTLKSFEFFCSIIRQLKGKYIYILPGSHDQNWFHSNLGYAEATVYERVRKLEPVFTLEVKDPRSKPDRYYLPIVLCHYAMKTWDRSHYGSLHLFGHSHGRLSNPEPNSMDIGVDCWDFYPVSLDEVLDRFGL